MYLELIVKSDEYLLHELNYKLIELLYAPNVIIHASNIHRVYAWSLRYNEFVQACVSNYENFFSKNEYSPLPLGGAKRMKLSERGRDTREKRAVNEVVPSAGEMDVERSVQGMDVAEVSVKEKEKRYDAMENDNDRMRGNRLEKLEARENEEKTGEHCDKNETEDSEMNTLETYDKDKINKESNEVKAVNNGKVIIDETEKSQSVIPASESNDKAMGKLTLTSLHGGKNENCDTKADKTDVNTASETSDLVKVDSDKASENNVDKLDTSKVPMEPGCSYKYDEMLQGNKISHLEKSTDNTKPKEIVEKVDDHFGNDTKNLVDRNVHKNLDEKSDNVESKKADVINLNDVIDIANEPQPCLISDLINEIDQNNKALLSKVPSTSALTPLTNVQNNIDQGKLLCYIGPN